MALLKCLPQVLGTTSALAEKWSGFATCTTLPESRATSMSVCVDGHEGVLIVVVMTVVVVVVVVRHAHADEGPVVTLGGQDSRRVVQLEF